VSRLSTEAQKSQPAAVDCPLLCWLI